MKVIKVGIYIILTFALLSCGNSSGDGEKTLEKIYYDNIGDSQNPLLNIVSVSVIKGETYVSIIISLQEITREIDVNKEWFSWNVDLDLNNDSTTVGDISAYILYKRNLNNNGKLLVSLLESLELYVTYSDPSNNSTVDIINNSELTVSGNNMIVTMYNNTHPAFNTFDHTVPISASTDSSTSVTSWLIERDSLPDMGGYTN